MIDKTALALEGILGIKAIGGGLILMVARIGEIMPLPLSALAGSSFGAHFVPGGPSHALWMGPACIGADETAMKPERLDREAHLHRPASRRAQVCDDPRGNPTRWEDRSRA